MVPVPGMTCLGMEYFCFKGDGLWESRDEDLVAQAARELAALGLARAEDVVDGAVIRMPKAYPIYDATYREQPFQAPFVGRENSARGHEAHDRERDSLGARRFVDQISDRGREHAIQSEEDDKLNKIWD